MNDFPFPFPGSPSPVGLVPPLDFSAGPSNAAASQSTPISVGGINSGGGSDLVPIALAVAAAWFLLGR